MSSAARWLIDVQPKTWQLSGHWNRLDFVFICIYVFMYIYMSLYIYLCAGYHGRLWSNSDVTSLHVYIHFLCLYSVWHLLDHWLSSHNILNWNICLRSIYGRDVLHVYIFFWLIRLMLKWRKNCSVKLCNKYITGGSLKYFIFTTQWLTIYWACKSFLVSVCVLVRWSTD